MSNVFTAALKTGKAIKEDVAQNSRPLECRNEIIRLDSPAAALTALGSLMMEAHQNTLDSGKGTTLSGLLCGECVSDFMHHSSLLSQISHDLSVAIQRLSPYSSHTL
jgi:hypothetical protein